MTLREHWDSAYQTKGATGVSWYQAHPILSLELIAASRVGKDAGVIDVGGGASTLVDGLLDAGYRGLAVLDVSPRGLAEARARLGERADRVEWIEADVTAFDPPHLFGLWHDRAVFHFLTDPIDRERYVTTLRRTLQPGGSMILAAFAVDGPSRCSGLDVVRYDEASIQSCLGPAFALQETRGETHRTPWGTEQRFVYFRFQWQPANS